MPQRFSTSFFRFLGLHRMGILPFFCVFTVLCVLLLGGAAYYATQTFDRLQAQLTSFTRAGSEEAVWEHASIESLQRIASNVIAVADARMYAKAINEAQHIISRILLSDSPYKEEAAYFMSLLTRQNALREKRTALLADVEQLLEEYNTSVRQLVVAAPTEEARQHFLQELLTIPLNKIGYGRAPELVQHSEPLLTLKQVQRLKNLVHTYAVEHPGKARLLACLAVVQKNYEYYTALHAKFERISIQLQQNSSELNRVFLEIRSKQTQHAGGWFVTQTRALHEGIDTAQGVLHLFLWGCGLVMIFLLGSIGMGLIRPLHWATKSIRTMAASNHCPPPPALRFADFEPIVDSIMHNSHVLWNESETGKPALERHAAAEEMLQAVLSTSADAYCVWNKEETPFFSEGFLFLFGVESTAHAEANKELLLIPPAHELAMLFDRVEAEGRVRGRYTFSTLSGVEIPCELTHVYLQDSGKVFTSVRDKRIQKRTEEDLAIVKQQAEEAMRMRSEFLSRVSLELRIPLNCVVGVTHVALEHKPDPVFDGYLRKIQSASFGLLQLINDIFDFSLLERNRLELFSTPFSLQQILQKMETTLAERAMRKGLNFFVVLDNRAPRYLNADGNRIRQILENLCDNAIKFTREGSVLLKVSVLKEEAGFATIAFEVHDTGIGIRKRQVPFIFQPFFQLEGQGNKSFSGSGLGLFLVKRLLELMGSSLKVKSDYGVGSIFSFTLTLPRCDDTYVALLEKSNEEAHTPSPLASQAEASDLMKGNFVHVAGDVSQGVPGSHQLAGKIALIVEDNVVNQEVAIAILESLGMSAVCAGNGQEALAVLAKRDVDIVLMDIQMPVMDGYTAAQHIRESGRESMRDVPIIALTAHNLPEDKEKSLAAGMNDHIAKPVSIDKLYQGLLRWLG